MITYSNANNDAVWELFGLSTDSKPIDKIPNGSTFREIDTGAEFMYDAGTMTWFKQPVTSDSGSTDTTPDDDTSGGDMSGDDIATDEEVKDVVDDIFG